MCIQLKEISKSFDKQIIFNKSNIDFIDNGLYFINGKSGCGKTTLLHIIAGYENVDEGERIVDKDVNFTMIFQNFELIDHMTVKENIHLYNTLYQVSYDNDQMIIESLGLNELLDYYPKELSHGQKQRVAIARALMTNADVFLCDEPTESLDKNNKKIVMDLLKKISNNHIVIVVSHDESLLRQYADVQYTINDYTIKKVEKKNCQKRHIIIEKEQINEKSLSQLFFHLSLKRNKIFYIMVMIFIFIIMILSNVYMGFDTRNSYALNDHVIYRMCDIRGQIPSVPIQPEEARIRFDFEDQVIIHNKTVHASVLSLPSEYNELSLLDGSYEGQGIIVNQVVAEDIKNALGRDDIIGENIDITFKMGRAYSSVLTFPIKGIVEEDKTLYMSHIYYPYQEVESFLKNQTFIYDNGERNVYDVYCKDYGLYYEMIYNKDMNMNDIYNVMKEKNINCYNQILDMSGLHEYHQSIIRLIILVIIVLFVIVMTLFLCIYNFSEYKQQLSNFTIIHTMGASIKQIKKSYMTINSSIFIILLVFTLLLEITFNQVILSIIFSFTNIYIYSKDLFIISTSVAVLYGLLYIISITIIQKVLSRKTLSSTIKEE